MKNKTYETIDEAMKLTLKPQWIEYLKLMARGGAFVADGRAIWEVWIDAVRAEFGDIGVEWKYNENKIDCHLENGEVYPGNIDYSQED